MVSYRKSPFWSVILVIYPDRSLRMFVLANEIAKQQMPRLFGKQMPLRKLEHLYLQDRSTKRHKTVKVKSNWRLMCNYTFQNTNRKRVIIFLFEHPILRSCISNQHYVTIPPYQRVLKFMHHLWTQITTITMWQFVPIQHHMF